MAKGLSRITPALRLAIAGGVVSALFSLLYQSPGVVLSPDGWAYWEGSVSLLCGEGYRYLEGPPIGAWPPGFSAYLALWQLLFGVSAGTLAVAHAAAIGVAAALWIAVAMRFFPERRLPPTAFAAAATLALLIPIALREVLSESLFMAWIGAALLVAAGVGGGETALQSGQRWAVLGFCSAGMLLTRHAGVAYLPALAWIASRSRQAASVAATVRFALLASAALAAWLAVLRSFGRFGNNPRVPFEAGFVARVAGNVLDNLAALASSLLPGSPVGVAGVALLAASLGLATGLEICRRESGGGAARAIPGLVPAAALASVCAVVVSALYDVRGARIVLPITTLVVLVLVHASAQASRAAVRRVAVVALFTLAAVQLGRAGYWVRHVSRIESAGLSWSLELVPPCAPGADCRRLPGQVKPPLFEWIERSESNAPSPAP
jgi:hypothetical protein